MKQPLKHPSLTPSLHHPVTLDIELFGVPRLLAGARTVAAAGETLGELAADLARRYPALAGRVLDAASGWPLDGYSFVVAERFTRDQSHPLHEGCSVLLVASAAGG
jgi:molybdopterin converting factor small subunit